MANKFAFVVFAFCFFCQSVCWAGRSVGWEYPQVYDMDHFELTISEQCPSETDGPPRVLAATVPYVVGQTAYSWADANIWCTGGVIISVTAVDAAGQKSAPTTAEFDLAPPPVVNLTYGE